MGVWNLDWWNLYNDDVSMPPSPLTLKYDMEWLIGHGLEYFYYGLCIAIAHTSMYIPYSVNFL